MIAIKEMKMPKGCSECPLLRGGSGELCCSVTGEPLFRIRDCPLVEIVTCKDCKHWHHDGIMTTCDKNIGHGFPVNHFCAMAERRE